MDQFSRTEMIFGRAAMEKLAGSRVAIFGIGGVGGWTAEALVRSGVGALDLIDSDKICLSNINRQIYATHKTLGQYKVDAAKERIAEINPECVVNTYKLFYLPETKEQLDFKSYDYIVDAVDTVSAKIALAVNAKEAGVPIISSMGAGNKVDPTAFETADIYDTSVCPLARVMRSELRRRGIKKLKVVYSREKPVKPLDGAEAWSERRSDMVENGAAGRRAPGSNAFVPSVAGLIIAGEVIKDLISFCPERR